MVKAYVLIAIDDPDVSKVAREMTDIDEVENIQIIYGEYDAIALVQSSTLVGLKELALEKIGKVKGVVKTSTLIVADED